MLQTSKQIRKILVGIETIRMSQTAISSKAWEKSSCVYAKAAVKAKLLLETFVFLLKARQAGWLLSESDTHTHWNVFRHRHSKTARLERHRFVRGREVRQRSSDLVNICARRLSCFLLNQKELGKHKHGWVMLSLTGPELEQTFSLSPSLWTWPQLSPHKQ